ncbi:hypothetical protein GCM10011410_24040 [Hoyosella rhizosphaerae]|uniref:Uncharacterized protein n=1 Tax=Hoyosella rhizosphaerae TaxID=1755582 RepID=A0A916UFD9_9ACTN|nr:hypothetical protein GCM10011410_24040 [Hoyosella rhizosphaerae]
MVTLSGVGVAAAKPFDTPPTPALCAGGVAVPQSFVAGDNGSLPPESVTYVINEQGGPGAMVAWLNVTEALSGAVAFGTVDLEPTPIGETAVAPLAMAETGPGTVLSAMFGLYENSRGETCVLLPGFTSDEVPAGTAVAAD